VSSASPWNGSGRRRGAPSSGATVALLRLDYLLTAFQTHHPISATSTHGTSARKTISTRSTTNAETAVRLVSAFASSVMKRQRGRSGIGSERGKHPNGMDPLHNGQNPVPEAKMRGSDQSQ